MRRYITATVTLIALAIFAGCATESTQSAHQPNEPFPGQIDFSGDFDHEPVMRFMPRTVFPPFLIARGVSGSATVSFKLRADGFVEAAKVENATEPAFGGSALGTVGRMVFKPATKKGVPVAVNGKVTFPFTYQ